MGFRPISPDEIDTASPASGSSFSGFRPITPDQIDPVPAPKRILGGAEQIAGGFGNILNGLTLGAGDEIVGGGAGTIDYLKNLYTGEDPKLTLSDAINGRIAQSEDLRQAFKNDSITGNIVGTGGEIIGSLANPINLVKVLKAASLPGKVAVSALEGGLQGGIYGFNSGEGGIAKRLDNATQDAALGSALGLGGGLLGTAVEKVTAPIGEGLQMSGLGINKAELRNAARSLPKTAEGAKATNPLIASFRRLKNEGLTSGGYAAADVLATLRTQSGDIGDELTSVLKTADNLGATDLPNFDKTKKFVFDQKGKDFKDAIKLYDEEVSGFIDTLDNGGTLADWQAAKKAAQGNVKYGAETSQLRNDIRSRIASDIRQHIEDTVDNVLPEASGAVKGLNQQLGDRAKLVKILAKQVDDPDPSNFIGKVTRNFGLPIVGAAVGSGGEYQRSGNLKNALIAGLGGAALTSSKGKFKIGEGLIGLGGALTRAGTTALPAYRIATTPTPTQPTPSTQGPTVMPKADDINLDKLPENKTDRVSYVEKLIDSDPVDAAIYKIESGRNPNAKNPESTASGAFQLLKRTASKLGVENVFDIAENYKGFLKLKEENQKVLRSLGLDENDPESIYSLHYLGAPTYKKWVTGGSLTAEQKAQISYLENKVLPKFLKTYQQEVKKLVEV